MEIPIIKREQNISATPSPTTSATIPEQKDYVQEATSKALGAGVDYFQKEAEVAADDHARKGYNQYRDEFNEGFNVGYEGKPGLRHTEGHDQFKLDRDQLVERLNKKTEKLLSEPGLSDYAKEKLKLKLDDATSTFQFYMDTQEGQVKIKEKTVQSKNEQENMGNDLTVLMDTFNPKRENALVHSTIQNMKATYDVSLYGRGLATKEYTTDKNGILQEKIVPSAIGAFEKKKDISEKIANSIIELGNKDPMAALAALKKYSDSKDILDTTEARIEKALKSSATLHEGYGAAVESVQILNDSQDIVKEKMKKYHDQGKPEVAKAYYQSVADISNKNETIEKNNSEIAINNAYRAMMAAAAKEGASMPQSVEEALLDTSTKAWHDQIRPMDLKKFEDFVKPPRVTSIEALEEMETFLLSGSSDNLKFHRLSAPLNKKARESSIQRFYDIRTDLKTVAAGGKSNRKATPGAYIVEMGKLNKLSGDFYDQDDSEETIKVRKKLSTWITNSGVTIPDYDSPEGIDNMANFLEHHSKDDVRKYPAFLGGKLLKRGAGTTMTDAQQRAEADRIRRERAKK